MWVDVFIETLDRLQGGVKSNPRWLVGGLSLVAIAGGVYFLARTEQPIIMDSIAILGIAFGSQALVMSMGIRSGLLATASYSTRTVHSRKQETDDLLERLRFSLSPLGGRDLEPFESPLTAEELRYLLHQRPWSLRELAVDTLDRCLCMQYSKSSDPAPRRTDLISLADHPHARFALRILEAQEGRVRHSLSRRRLFTRERLQWDEADLRWADLTGAYLEGANLRRAYLEGANLRRAYLAGADLRWANLFRAYLTGADLQNANLGGANLTEANLARANLAGANLFRADLTGAYLTGAYLTGADLTGADLTGADLQNANLGGANLRGANLTGVNLTEANLAGADLAGANLFRADLTGADLTGANLFRADLKGVLYLEPETLVRAKYLRDAILDDDIRAAAEALAADQAATSSPSDDT